MDSRDLKGSHTLGVCIKDSHRIVLFQNSPCREKCGNKEGTVCGGPCLQRYDEYCRTKKMRVEGFCPFPKLGLEFGTADAIVVDDGHQLLTLIYPLDDKHRLKMDYYRQRNLTKSEMNIISLLLEGLSNSEIARRLFISRATLKTHINNIYKKIPAEMRPRS